MIMTVSNTARITGAPSWIEKVLNQRLTFDNPLYTENEKRGFSNWNVPEKLCYLSQDCGSLVFPRAFTRQARSVIRKSGQELRVQDNRRILPEVDFTFLGGLRNYQQEALKEILSRDFATVSIPTGGGKTIIALAAIARRQQSALVVVHTKELLNQWIERIESFLGIPGNEVGVIGGGKFEIGGKLTVGLVQSLYKRAAEVAPKIGHLIVDECHRAPSRVFTEAVTAFDCRYQLGLSATPFRRDKLNRLIYWYLGDVVYKIDRKDLIESHDILPAEVIKRDTTFQPTVDPSANYSQMLSELCQDHSRNMLITSDVAQEVPNNPGVCLVLSDRKSHCETLRGMLSERGIEASLLTGDLKERERRQVVEDIRAGKAKVIVATAQLIGEGFDAKELSTLFLATPIKFTGRLIQCLGRVLRPAPGKEKAVVYDYIDPVGVLQGAARSRAWVYGQVA